MSHEIVYRNGRYQAVYGSGEMPWHHDQTGCTILDGLLTGSQVLEALEIPHYETWRGKAFNPETGEEVECEDFAYSVARWPDGEVVPVGQVMKGFGQYQYEDFLRIAEPIIEEFGAVFDAGGILLRGAEYWLTAKLPDTINVTEKDQYQGYLGFYCGATGSLALNIFPTMTRMVCRNTTTFAERGAKSRIRKLHKGDTALKVDEAREELEQYWQAFQEGRTTFLEMLDVPLSTTELTNFVLQSIGLDLPAIKRGEKDWTGHALTKLEEIAYILEHGNGARRTPEQKGTLKYAYDTAVEWCDHYRTRKGKNKSVVRNTLFDGAAKVKAGIYQQAKQILTADGKIEEVYEVVDFADKGVEEFSDLLATPRMV